jgi:GT2 family glycosyltransferase
MVMNKDVYFIVVTYNGMKWIEKCIKSIYNNHCNNIIIVDNYSTDGTIEFINKNFPDVKLVELKKNNGFGAANNIGIKLAIESGCSYVFLLNQDAYLEKGSLSILLKTIRQRSNIGIISPIHLNGSKTAFDRNFSYTLSNISDHALLNDLYFGRLNELYNVPFVNAAAWLISKKCINRVGFFDSVFFHYGEDDNYCHRVKYHGFEIAINTQAIVLHDREDRNGNIRPEYFKDQYIRSKLIDFCNPFNNANYEISKFLKHQRIEIVKSIIKLDFKKLKEAERKYNFIRSKRAEILNSYNKNKVIIN